MELVDCEALCPGGIGCGQNRVRSRLVIAGLAGLQLFPVFIWAFVFAK
jgi:hypothetical protein